MRSWSCGLTSMTARVGLSFRTAHSVQLACSVADWTVEQKVCDRLRLMLARGAQAIVMGLDLVQVLIELAFAQSQPGDHGFLAATGRDVLDLEGDLRLKYAVCITFGTCTVLRLPFVQRIQVDQPEFVAQLVRCMMLDGVARSTVLRQSVRSPVALDPCVTRAPCQCRHGGQLVKADKQLSHLDGLSISAGGLQGDDGTQRVSQYRCRHGC